MTNGSIDITSVRALKGVMYCLYYQATPSACHCASWRPPPVDGKIREWAHGSVPFKHHWISYI